MGEFSGLVYDQHRGVYYGLPDRSGTTVTRVYTLDLPLDGGALGSPTAVSTIVLRDAAGNPFSGAVPTADGRTRARILRYEDRGPGGFEVAGQSFYLTEPGQRISDMVALSESDVLVLERGRVAATGNTVRVFRASLEGAADVSNQASLNAPNLSPVPKTLLVDVVNCPPSGATNPQPQANPLLDNFEALALGPALPGGRRALILISDDNLSAAQVTRVIALAVPTGLLVREP